MEVTRANPEDIQELCRLLTVLFTQEAEFEPDQEAQLRGLASIVGNPKTGQILVARINGTIVGMVNLLYTVSTALGERVALLEDMVVSPESRNLGVGSLLLKHVIDTAKASGCKRITLLTDGGNESAQRFYGRHGFKASSMVPFRLSLDDAV